MTAIPLQAWTAAPAEEPSAPSSPTASPAPTTTPSPTDEPGAVATDPAAASTVAAATVTSTPLPATPSTEPTDAPSRESTDSPSPEPTSAQARPRATPELGGKLVIQTSIGGDLYTVNADGSGLRRLTDGVDPTWSPNGEQIAFTRWREPRGVWVIDANGSNERRVFDWNEARWPSWSPDAGQILFSRQHGGRLEEDERCFWGRCFTLAARPHWKLGIVNVEDGAFVEPLSADLAWAPVWSPVGAQILYDGEHGLWIQTVGGEVSYQISHDARDTTPAWSPDGNRVAFARWQHDHWEIYAVDSDGRNLRRLTDTPPAPSSALASSVSPTWSPDGKHLAFMTDRTGRWEVWVMEASGGGQKPMFEGSVADLVLDYAFLNERAISWAP